MRSKQVSVWLALVLGLVILALVAGCSGKVGEKPGQAPPTPGPAPKAPTAEQPSSTSNAPSPSGEPVKIGAIFSVTGPAAPLGEPEQLAAEMVEEAVNKTGGILGRPLKIIIEDDGSEESKAASAVKKLIEQEKVCAIIGPTLSGTTLAIVDAIQKAEIPMFACAASAKITHPVKKWVFSCAQTDVLAVKRIVKYLTKAGLKKAGIIYDSNAFGVSGAEQLKQQLPAAGIEIVDEEKFATKDTDMTAQLTKIKAKNPDVVICWGTNPGPAVVAKNAKTLGITAQLIMSHGVADKKFIELAGDAAEGVMLPVGKLMVVDQLPDSDPQKAILKQFTTDFEAFAKRPPNTFSGHAYDSLMLLFKAIEEAKSDDPAAIRDALEQIKDFPGVSGVFNLSAEDHNGLSEDAFAFVKIENGKWVQVK